MASGIVRRVRERRALRTSVQGDLDALSIRARTQELLDAPLQLMRTTHGHVPASAMSPQQLRTLCDLFDQIVGFPPAGADEFLPANTEQYAGLWICDPHRERGAYGPLDAFPSPAESAFVYGGRVRRIRGGEVTNHLDVDRALERSLLEILIACTGTSELDALAGDKPL